MAKPSFQSPLAIWLYLMVLTSAAFAICEGKLFASFSTLAIILLAAFKARLVILYFMEARHVPRPWRLLYETWNFAVAAIIVIGHYVTIQAA